MKLTVTAPPASSRTTTVHGNSSPVSLLQVQVKTIRGISLNGSGV
jgi:hypothetical protein